MPASSSPPSLPAHAPVVLPSPPSSQHSSRFLFWNCRHLASSVDSLHTHLTWRLHSSTEPAASHPHSEANSQPHIPSLAVTGSGSDPATASILHGSTPIRVAIAALAETHWDATRRLPTIPHYEWITQHHTPNSGGLACLVHDSIARREVDGSHPSLSALALCSDIKEDQDDSSALL
jgi:hypothetical protein